MHLNSGVYAHIMEQPNVNLVVVGEGWGGVDFILIQPY